jgi:outer membrane protein TolC
MAPPPGIASLALMRGGVVTYLQVITAQTIELANERNDIDILRRRLDASVL